MDFRAEFFNAFNHPVFWVLNPAALDQPRQFGSGQHCERIERHIVNG